MRFSITTDNAGRQRWWLYSDSDHIVAFSQDQFETLDDAAYAALRFRESASWLRYEIYAERGTQFRWRARTKEGVVVALSGAAWYNSQSAHRAAERMRSRVADAELPA